MRATVFALLAALSFSGMSACVHGLSSDLSGMTAVCFRTGVGFLIAFLTMRFSGVAFQINNKKVMAIRVVSGTIALCAFFQALTMIDLTTITLLKFTSPIAVSILAWAFLKEEITRRQVLGLPLAIAGVLLVIFKPGSGNVAVESTQYSVGLLLGLVGSLLAAVAYVSLRTLGKTEQPIVVVTSFALVAFLVSLPFAVHSGISDITQADLYALIGAAIFGTAGQFFITHAYKTGRATSVSIVGLSQVPVAAFLSWLLFDEVLGPYSVVGGVLIVASVALQTKAKKAVDDPNEQEGEVDCEQTVGAVGLRT